MKRAELDWLEPRPPTIGGAETLPRDDHGGHAFLYVPDLSSRTGWASHSVPERQEKRDKRPVGFRR